MRTVVCESVRIHASSCSWWRTSVRIAMRTGPNVRNLAVVLVYILSSDGAGEGTGADGLIRLGLGLDGRMDAWASVRMAAFLRLSIGADGRARARIRDS